MRTATRAAVAAVAAVVAVLLSAEARPASGSIAPTPEVTPAPPPTSSDFITSAGPLATIEVTPDLNCAVQHTGDHGPAFFEDTACATLLSLSANGTGALYGPAKIPGSGQYVQARIPWGSNPQTLSGTGTSADPYRLRTVWSVGGSRVAFAVLRSVAVVETDSYVVGEDSYRTDIQVINELSSRVDATVYHAADCQLADSDVGLGSYSPTTGAITCHAPGASGVIAQRGQAISFIPLTLGSNHLYGDAARVWSVISAQHPFPDAVEGGDDPSVDNAIGLSWSFSLGAGTSTKVSLRTSFAPTEVLPLPSSVSLSTGSLGVGGQATASVSIENPNPFTQVIAPLTATLPPGVAYVAGSTRGLGEPVLDGRTLDFGMVSVGAVRRLQFTFAVVATAAGTGALAVGGRTRSGVPVRTASATLIVNPQHSPSGTSGGAPGRIAPVVVAWGSWGAWAALAAAALIIVAATTIAVTRRPRRMQKKLVRVHVRLDPHQATVIRYPPPREEHLPSPPTFRLQGRSGPWTHRVIEEQT